MRAHLRFSMSVARPPIHVEPAMTGPVQVPVALKPMQAPASGGHGVRQ